MTEWVLSSCLLIMVVLLLRAALGKRISAGLRYGLWLVVLTRLLTPVSIITLSFTVPQLPEVTPPPSMQEKSIYVLPVDRRPVEEAGIFIRENGEVGDANSFGYPKLSDSGETVVRYAGKISPAELLRWIWIGGAVVIGAVLIGSNVKFYFRLRRMRRRLENVEAPVPVYMAAGVPSPCLFGLIRPAVYITEETAANPVMLHHVLCHELTHYKHFDHIWSALRGAALAVHWWNPLVWLAVVYSRQDSELACDEGALKHLGDGERTAYGETLLALVTEKRRPGDLFACATTMSGGKRSLQERIRRIAKQPKQLVSAMVLVIAVLSLTVLVAFGQGREDDIPSSASASADAPIAVSPDLDRDGEPEILYVRQPENYPEAGEWRLEIMRQPTDTEEPSDLIWSVTLDETHGNCGTYFLYEQDGKDYLLEYMPKMQQGYCTYFYRLFHLENGKEVTDVENSLEFDINFSSADHRFDPKEITDFMHEVNAFLSKSHLLLNTNHWMLFLEEDAEHRLHDNILRAIGYNGNTDYDTDDDLLAALTVYSAYAEDHPDDIESPLGMLLEDLTPEDIGDISAQKEVTVTELAEILHETSDLRSSRYHTYNSFEAEEVWTWSMAEWAVPLTAGGTLHLMACDSGNVEMSYETEDGAVSAFFSQPQELYDLIIKVGQPYFTEVLPYDVDLDRDGSPDRLFLRSEHLSGGILWTLQCSLDYGSTWRGMASTAHPGWTSFYLCQMDGKDCLLEYTPYMGMGTATYSYKLFCLEGGRETILQKNEVSFDINFGIIGDQDFDPRAIAAFMEEVNTLLADSTLLLNTDSILAETFERERRLYDSLFWLDDTREEGATLLENLLIYRNRAMEEAAVPDISDLLANITRDGITALAGGSIITGGDIVQDIADALNRVSGQVTVSQEEREQENGGPDGRPELEIRYHKDPYQCGIYMEAGETEGEVWLDIEGSATVLIYSENPDNDASYLEDISYTVTGHVEDTEFWQLIVDHGADLVRS